MFAARAINTRTDDLNRDPALAAKTRVPRNCDSLFTLTSETEWNTAYKPLARPCNDTRGTFARCARSSLKLRFHLDPSSASVCARKRLALPREFHILQSYDLLILSPVLSTHCTPAGKAGDVLAELPGSLDGGG